MPSILITGGTRGIGLALCKAFAQKGWDVSTCYHQDEESAKSAAAELSQITANFSVVKCDVSKEEPVNDLVRRTVEIGGGLDCVIHVAGATWNARLVNVEESQWDDTLDVHLKGAFLTAK